MNQTGIVLETHDNIAKVKLQKHSACGDCGACQHGVENMVIEIEALNEIHAETGDFVTVDLESANVLGAAFIVYVIPLIMFLVSMFLTKTFIELNAINYNVELVSALMGFVAMAITFMIIKHNDTRFHRSKKYLSTITSIVAKPINNIM